MKIPWTVFELQSGQDHIAKSTTVLKLQSGRDFVLETATYKIQRAITQKV